MMMIFLKIFNVFSGIFEMIKKNPKFFLGLVVAAFIVIFFRQCEANKQLKQDIKVMNVIRENESNRTVNNLKALKDSVVFHKETSTYLKDIVRAKDNETILLTNRLETANNKLIKIAKEIDDKSEVSNVFVVDLQSDTFTNDVLTNVGRDSIGNYSIGIKDSTSVFSVETKTWFNFKPEGNVLKLFLVDKYGSDKSSELKHRFNFTLNIGQVELENGRTRILINPVDIDGNEIPTSILNIPYADGVNFIDVEPKIIPLPEPIRKRTGFGVVIGPTVGFGYGNGVFNPTIGIGITIGYRIF